MLKQRLNSSRRNFLLRTLHGAGLIFLPGCDRVYESETFRAVLSSAEGVNRRVQRFLTGKNKLAQEFSDKDVSRVFKANGNEAPQSAEFAADAANQWTAWRLEVTGLVAQPAQLTLEELKAMPARTQITRHDCVEGWSAIGKWKGVPLARIIEQAQPGPEAKYILFHCIDTDSRGNRYYESIDLETALHPQTILAYEMNDRPLPVAHGAPLRLRVETQLGYKHAKYIRGLEFVASFENFGKGKGGYWEDRGYQWYAGI
jgi:DMSO/TMAO reductase YedYZ molybdopterin-dependent catalytic subunit